MVRLYTERLCCRGGGRRIGGTGCVGDGCCGDEAVIGGVGAWLGASSVGDGRGVGVFVRWAFGLPSEDDTCSLGPSRAREDGELICRASCSVVIADGILSSTDCPDASVSGIGALPGL